MRDLILDVDGVCADFTGALIAAVGSDLTPEDVVKWDVIGMFTPEQRELAYGYLNEPDFWRNLPLIDHAQEGVKFMETTHQILWVTSPWKSCEGWEAARRDWLNEHFKMEEKNQVYIPTSSKEKVKAEIMIDDKPENLQSWHREDNGGQAYIFDAPYNRDFHEFPRVSWERILDVSNLRGAL